MKIPMKRFKNLCLLYLLLIFSLIGCSTGLQTRALPSDITAATSGVVISLTTPQSTYTSEAAIPLKLKIQGGAFDLLVPSLNLTTPHAFIRLKVTDTENNTVEPKRAIVSSIPEEIFIQKNGKSIRCIQGVELGAATTTNVSLADIQKYYRLQKGVYTITLTTELSVYRDSLKKRHPEIIELEEEIRRIQKVADAHVSAADKRSAVNDLQQQIAFLEKKHNTLYLPMNALLGKAQLTANSVVVTIE